ncbi:MAG: arsenic efflux protein [Bacteroidales bacterium]|nr:arsenic efflux protein [Bacteroidales bacterium]
MHTHTFLHQFMDIITGTVSITCLVMVMMLLIEFVNVSSSGRLLSKLQKRPYLQVMVASLLGLIPGCIGGFTIVSLYTHRLLTFGALVAGMISTFGDSAFLLFAMSPRTAPVLLGSLFVIALFAGVVTHLLFRNRPFYSDDPHTLEVHQGDQHEHGHGKAQLSWQNIRKMSFSRAILIFGLVLYLTALGTGAISHEHGSMPDMDNLENKEVVVADCHEHCCEHDHHHHTEAAVEEHHEHHLHGENLVFGILALITLLVVAFCSEHFLQEHLWEHVIKHHFISVLLWTFGVLVALAVVNYFVDLEMFIKSNQWVTWMLLFLALALGIIPESQPQFIWIYLYAAGVLPFSILLASSIVQDGHGALPLLAYSRKSFLMLKAANIVFGLLVGLAGMIMNF